MALLDLKTVNPALRLPEAKPALMAFVDLLIWRANRTYELREKADTSTLSLFDQTVWSYIVAYELAGHGGTRQQTLINTLKNVPRTTIRDSLRKLRKGNLIIRDHRNLYHPTTLSGLLTEDGLSEAVTLLNRLAETFLDWRNALDRHPRR